MCARTRVCALRVFVACAAAVMACTAGVLMLSLVRTAQYTALQASGASVDTTANLTQTHEVALPAPLSTGCACAAPLFYTVCGDHADYHSMSVGMLRTAHAWLDPARRARARFVLVVGPRIAAARAAGELSDTPAFIEYVQPNATAMHECGLRLEDERIGWAHVRFPVLPALQAAYADTTCIVYADADEAVAAPLIGAWAALDAAGGARADTFYATPEGIVGTDNAFSAGPLWAEYAPALAANVSRLTDLNSGNFIIATNATIVAPVVERFCGIMRQRRADGVALPLDQPLVSFALGMLTPAAPYAAVNHGVLGSLVEGFAHECTPPVSALAVWSHFSGQFGNAAYKLPLILCAIERSLTEAAAAPWGRLRVRINGTIAAVAAVGDGGQPEQTIIVLGALVGVLGVSSITLCAIVLATARWTCCCAARARTQAYTRQLDTDADADSAGPPPTNPRTDAHPPDTSDAV